MTKTETATIVDNTIIEIKKTFRRAHRDYYTRKRLRNNITRIIGQQEVRKLPPYASTLVRSVIDALEFSHELHLVEVRFFINKSLLTYKGLQQYCTRHKLDMATAVRLGLFYKNTPHLYQPSKAWDDYKELV